MSRRILVAGGSPDRRASLAACLDSAFDVDVRTAEGPLDAMRLLPNVDLGLVLIVLPVPDGEAPGLDLVRVLSAHARHGRVPIAVLGGSEDERAGARTFGARVLPEDCPDEDLRSLARDLLGIG